MWNSKFRRGVVIKTSLLLPSLMMPTSNCWTSHSRNKERKQRLQTSINVTGINKYSEIGNVSAVKMESVIQ